MLWRIRLTLEEAKGFTLIKFVFAAGIPTIDEAWKKGESSGESYEYC